MSTMRQLEQLIEDLEAGDGDEQRLQAARCALGFKRSWIDLAAILSDIQASGSFEQWGYDDLVGYAQAELGIKGPTVDKLLVSYATLNKHAPDRIAGGVTEGALPSVDALDYYARATGEPRADGSMPRNAPSERPSDDVLQQLHSAVFDEGRSAHQLRRDFDPLVRPRSPEEQQLIALRRASATARRLLELIAEVEGLESAQVQALSRAIEALQREITQLTAELQEEAAA